MAVLSLFGFFFKTPFHGASQTYFVSVFTLCLRGCFVFLGNNFRIICCSSGTLYSCLHTSQELCLSVCLWLLMPLSSAVGFICCGCFQSFRSLVIIVNGVITSMFRI